MSPIYTVHVDRTDESESVTARLCFLLALFTASNITILYVILIWNMLNMGFGALLGADNL